jgi:hypothetical protein
MCRHDEDNNTKYYEMPVNILQHAPDKVIVARNNFNVIFLNNFHIIIISYILIEKLTLYSVNVATKS